jgi:hypothetical protein
MVFRKFLLQAIGTDIVDELGEQEGARDKVMMMQLTPIRPCLLGGTRCGIDASQSLEMDIHRHGIAIRYIHLSPHSFEP